MSQNTFYCCQEIDDPNNKWVDCNPCEETKLLCNMLENKNECDMFKKYCEWSNEKNKCYNNPNSPQYAKSITPCTKSFSNTSGCFTQAEINKWSQPYPSSETVMNPIYLPSYNPNTNSNAPLNPNTPTNPVSPNGPVSPVGPISPVGPVSPVGPISPVSPVSPINSVSSVISSNNSSVWDKIFNFIHVWSPLIILIIIILIIYVVLKSPKEKTINKVNN